jgi:thiol-disulfide isomerase/thioredoxin
LYLVLNAQQPADRILYGTISKDSLQQAPYNKWFNKNYADYTTDGQVKKQLEALSLKGITIEIIMGTWCGDSKREVPRFLKILEDINFDNSKIKIIGVGNGDSLYKQSPQGEEKGKGIFRVPVFIIYKNGVETGRINEFAAASLERDFLAIAGNAAYSPNYKSFFLIKKWMNESILADSNANIRGLAAQVKMLVANEHELNSAGYVLLKQGSIKEAVTLFRINAILYPESGNVLSSLGEGYLQNGSIDNAVAILENSLVYENKIIMAEQYNCSAIYLYWAQMHCGYL